MKVQDVEGNWCFSEYQRGICDACTSREPKNVLVHMMTGLFQEHFFLHKLFHVIERRDEREREREKFTRKAEFD